jgi:hypothetical protein
MQHSVNELCYVCPQQQNVLRVKLLHEKRLEFNRIVTPCAPSIEENFYIDRR